MFKELLKILIGTPILIGLFYLMALAYGFLYNLMADHIIMMFFIVLFMMVCPIFKGIKDGDI